MDLLMQNTNEMEGELGQMQIEQEQIVIDDQEFQKRHLICMQLNGQQIDENNVNYNNWYKEKEVLDNELKQKAVQLYQRRERLIQRYWLYTGVLPDRK